MELTDQIEVVLLLLRISSPLFWNEWRLLCCVFAYASFTKGVHFDKTKVAAHGTAGRYGRAPAVPTVIKVPEGLELIAFKLVICLISSN